MNILMVTPHLPPYQAANALLPHVLGQELEKRGHGVSFLTFKTSDPERPRTAYINRRTRFRVTRVPQLLEALETRRKARPLLDRADIAHVHSNTWMNQVAARAAVRLGKPYVLTHYGTEIWHHDGRNHAFRTLNQNARHTTFYSAGLLARARELDVPIREASVVYPAVDLLFSPLAIAERNAVRAPLLSSGELLLFNVKRLHPLADHATLLRAFALLDPTPAKLRLVIAGSGDERAGLESLAKELGISSRVRFLGLVPNQDVAKLHAAADLFVLSSRLEATPTVVLEALACGTRVVSTDNPGGLELGALFPDDLLIVPRENPQALADGIAAALRENRRISERTSRVIDERFSLRGLVDRYCEIYEKALP
ncbi:MAG: glycosyltransferase family 4 protein [Vicinamibacteria bacterium]|nr:glycosyltransferase family 4 protein [Vicinamibacteria bacterium]